MDEGLGRSLTKVRVDAGITQEEMARWLGIATSTLRLFEQGKANLSPRLRAKVVGRISSICPPHFQHPDVVDPNLEEPELSSRLTVAMDRFLQSGIDTITERLIHRSEPKIKVLCLRNLDLRGMVSQELVEEFRKGETVTPTDNLRVTGADPGLLFSE